MGGSATRYTILPLEGSTWAVFAELTERNNGVYGGCWCMGYHPGALLTIASTPAGSNAGNSAAKPGAGDEADPARSLG